MEQFLLLRVLYKLPWKLSILHSVLYFIVEFQTFMRIHFVR